MDDNDFYTLRGYDRLDKSAISTTMEDYLEMICRIVREKKFVRVNQLAGLLNVTPPSASKMVNKLKEIGMVDFEPYGIIQVTKEGERLGDYLLHRHEVLNRFFCRINATSNELELVEKIEHFMDQRTVANLESWLEDNPDKSQ